MTEQKPRRRALCVRPRLNADAPSFLHAISDEWVHALALHCDVSTIEHDFDFREVCDRIQPDFVIFDAVHWVRPQRIEVANADAHPHIPRAFYFNCDPHDPMRPRFFEMLHGYGIDTIFCGVEHLKQMPELGQLNCFVLPLFIDDGIYRDYGLERNIPVSVFGGHAFPDFYPWRAKLLEEMQRIIPTLVYPHPGYNARTGNPFEVRDEKYARLLAASRFSVADTTRLDYVVRKHLEIPAAGAVLIAPDSEVIKALGFADMENCILGEGEALYRKVQAAAADPALYESIRRSGHALVHSRYTRAHWTHIVDWFECRAACGPHEMTQQMGRFGGFRNVPLGPDIPSVAGLHLEDDAMSTALATAGVAIQTGDNLALAKAQLDEVCTWIGHIAEPHFLLGVIAMLEGRLDDGFQLISRRAIITINGERGLGQLDPCELAWLLLIAAIKAEPALCKVLLERAETTPHVSVRRALWILFGSSHDVDFGEEGLMAPRPGDWPSIHWIGQESFPSWLLMMSRLMAANGLSGAADYMRMIADAFSEDTDDEVAAQAGVSHAA